MADGAMDDATFARLRHRPGAARARRRLQLARVGQLDAARARVPRRAPGPVAGDVLGRRADARVAGPRAGRRPRPAAARRAHQPPRHRVAGVAGGAICSRSTPPSCWWRTTAGSSRPSAPRCSSSRPGAAKFFKGTWHAWRAEKAQRELALGRAIEKQQAEIAKLERFVDPLPRRHARAPGAGAPEEARQDRPAHDRPEGRQGRSASPSSRPSAPAASSSRSRTGC